MDVAALEEGAKALVKEVKALPAAVREQGALAEVCGVEASGEAPPLPRTHCSTRAASQCPSPCLKPVIFPPGLPCPAADCFRGLEVLVKNYLASVPLIGDLRSPAMRPRHWQALQEATKVGGHCSKGRHACQAWAAAPLPLAFPPQHTVEPTHTPLACLLVWA